MRKNYKYLMMLIFILNFTNIYSQSNSYAYTWYNESIGTLYIDKQLLESSASMLSQYLGPLAPIIITNLPYLVSFFSLFFIFKRFLNIIHEDLGHKNTIIAATISAIATYLFWPFVIPILIIAFIIKAFRVGKSKLENFKENLGKINPGLKGIFSRTTSDIKDFDKNTNKILKDINKLDKIINHPYIRNLLNSIEKDIETLNNIIFQLSKETENEKLTPYILTAYSSKFNMTYNNAINKIKQLNGIINTMFRNPSLLRSLGNRIFRTNKFTPKYLVELRNIPNNLTARLNTTYKEGQKIFEDLNRLLISAEAISRKYGSEIDNTLKRNLNNNAFLSLGKKAPIREIQKIENATVAIYKDWRISPLKKLEISSKMYKSTKNLSKSLRKFKGNPKRLLNLTDKYYKKTIKSIRSIPKTSEKR
ncbi:MAG: hypothetical protein RXO36_01970 [Candidatus Nanopusillus acidilobi]